MELLSNIDITSLAKSMRIPLIHIGFKEEFNFKPVDGCYVVNLDKQTSGKGGTHWTCFVMRNGNVIYFDPFGMAVPTQVAKFIHNYKPRRAIFSINQIQAMDSILCGYYILYFLYYFSVKFKNCCRIEVLLNKHNSLYSLVNRDNNDLIIQDIFRKLYTKL